MQNLCKFYRLAGSFGKVLVSYFEQLLSCGCFVIQVFNRCLVLPARFIGVVAGSGCDIQVRSS